MAARKNGNGTNGKRKPFPVCKRSGCSKKVKRRDGKFCSLSCGALNQNGKADAIAFEDLRDAFLEGGTDATAAATVGISRGGLGKLVERTPGLADAIEIWKGVADHAVQRNLHAIAKGERDASKGEITAIVWWDKNRLGWRDRGEMNITGSSLADLLVASEKADG